MKNQLKKAHKTHSFVWWTSIILIIVFIGFLILISTGHFSLYEDVMAYFSPSFFVLTLGATIIMSYNRALVRRGKHKVGPFLTSILFGVLTQFVFFILSPLVDWSDELNPLTIGKMTIFFVLPSFVAFFVLKFIVDQKSPEDQEDYSWFDWNYYLSWMELMTNIMTLVTFIDLFFVSEDDKGLMGIRGTIWAFYSIVASFLGDHIFKEERYGK